MWTCGIDIATQQATPATHKIACNAFGEIPSARGLNAGAAREYVP
jgi:hypothetical protein